MGERKQRLGPAQFSLHTLIMTQHGRDASDPRDKVFALLAVDEHMEIVIEPDYNQPTAEIFTELTAKYVEQKSSLGFSVSSGIGVAHTDLQQPLGLPSWVPDLRSSSIWPLSLANNPAFNTTDGLSPVLKIDRQLKALFASGVEVDSVSNVLEDSDGFKKNWHEFIRTYDVPHPTGAPQIHVFIRTQVLDSSEGLGYERGLKKTFIEYSIGFMYLIRFLELKRLSQEPGGHDVIRTCVDSVKSKTDYAVWFAFWLLGSHARPISDSDRELLIPLTGKPGSHSYIDFPEPSLRLGDRGADYALPFLRKRKECVRSRKLFAIKKGYIGLGPNGMRVGDRLFVLLGGQVPFIIREITDHHVNVGQCYVYGLMYGEVAQQLKAKEVRVQQVCLR